MQCFGGGCTGVCLFLAPASQLPAPGLLLSHAPRLRPKGGFLAGSGEKQCRPLHVAAPLQRHHNAPLYGCRRRGRKQPEDGGAEEAYLQNFMKASERAVSPKLHLQLGRCDRSGPNGCSLVPGQQQRQQLEGGSAHPERDCRAVPLCPAQSPIELPSWLPAADHRQPGAALLRRQAGLERAQKRAHAHAGHRAARHQHRREGGCLRGCPPAAARSCPAAAACGMQRLAAAAGGGLPLLCVRGARATQLTPASLCHHPLPPLQAVAIARKLLEADNLELYCQPAFRDR